MNWLVSLPQTSNRNQPPVRRVCTQLRRGARWLWPGRSPLTTQTVSASEEEHRAQEHFEALERDAAEKAVDDQRMNEVRGYLRNRVSIQRRRE